jgi:hypothetical protein
MLSALLLSNLMHEVFGAASHACSICNLHVRAARYDSAPASSLLCSLTSAPAHAGHAGHVLWFLQCMLSHGGEQAGWWDQAAGSRSASTQTLLTQGQ